MSEELFSRQEIYERGKERFRGLQKYLEQFEKMPPKEKKETPVEEEAKPVPNEKQLTEDQQNRINEIKKKWIDEIKKIPEKENTGHLLDCKPSEPYYSIYKKYMPQIQAIMDEDTEKPLP